MPEFHNEGIVNNTPNEIQVRGNDQNESNTKLYIYHSKSNLFDSYLHVFVSGDFLYEPL